MAMDNKGNLEKQIGDLLRGRELTLGVVESATGGLISHRITSVSGSSGYFKGSIISYCYELKVSLVGINPATLRRYGAVSHQVAGEMAAGGRERLGVDICLADTGIAGPDGAVPGKPVGRFYLGLSDLSGTGSRQHDFSGDREQNKNLAAETALEWLREYLLSLK